jgi:hypothetical protein
MIRCVLAYTCIDMQTYACTQRRGTPFVMEYLRKILEGKVSGNVSLFEIGLETFPIEVVTLDGIQTLDASLNAIPSLPNNLGALSSLKTLLLQVTIERVCMCSRIRASVCNNATMVSMN